MKYLKEGKWEEFKPMVSNIHRKMLELQAQIDEINSNLLSEVADIMIDLEDYQNHYEVFNDPSRSYLLCEYIFTIPSDKIELVLDLCDKLDEYIDKDRESWGIDWVNVPGADYKFRDSSIKDVMSYLDSKGAPEPKLYNVEFTFFKIESAL